MVYEAGFSVIGILTSFAASGYDSGCLMAGPSFSVSEESVVGRSLFLAMVVADPGPVLFSLDSNPSHVERWRCRC